MGRGAGGGGGATRSSLWKYSTLGALVVFDETRGGAEVSPCLTLLLTMLFLLADVARVGGLSMPCDFALDALIDLSRWVASWVVLGLTSVRGIRLLEVDRREEREVDWLLPPYPPAAKELRAASRPSISS